MIGIEYLSPFFKSPYIINAIKKSSLETEAKALLIKKLENKELTEENIKELQKLGILKQQTKEKTR